MGLLCLEFPVLLLCNLLLSCSLFNTLTELTIGMKLRRKEAVKSTKGNHLRNARGRDATRAT